jgi:hypothetical protein
MSARLLAIAEAVVGLVSGKRVTTRSATEEFGMTPAVRYETELADYTDADLLQFDALKEVQRARDYAYDQEVVR